MELYLFSINFIDESKLNSRQIKIKKPWQIDFHGYEDFRFAKDWINTKDS